MAAGRLKNKSAGLRLELNTSCPENESISNTGNWRQNIARFVSHDDDVGSDMRPDDFEKAIRLGEGAAGTVWKVMHVPSKIVMAKKVKNPLTPPSPFYPTFYQID